MGSKREAREKPRKRRPYGASPTGSSPSGMFRFILLLGFIVGLTIYEYASLAVSVAAPRQKSTRSSRVARLRSTLLAHSASEDLVEQAISELESVIIATSSTTDGSDGNTEANKRYCMDEDSLRVGRQRLEFFLGSDQESFTNDETVVRGENNDDEEDSGDSNPTSCAEGEVLVNGVEYERIRIILDFDKEMSLHKTFRKLTGIPESFDTFQTARELPELKFGPSNHMDIESIISAVVSSTSQGEKQDSDDVAGGNGGESPDDSEETAAELASYQEQLRIGKTYSNVHKKFIPMHKALKSLGYKQSTIRTKRSPFIMGYAGDSCPSSIYSTGEQRILFCTHLVPSLREQDQYRLLHEYATENPGLGIDVDKLFPMTFRLFAGEDLKLLKARVFEVSLELEGGPYITKITSAHGAGSPSLTVKMSDLLKKSHQSTKIQNSDAKLKKIVQVYINNPYLYEGKKFIIRNWAVVVSVDPLIVLFRDGAIFRAVESYVPFVKRDSSYKRAMHYTNDKSSHKGGPLRSSALYASLSQFQKWLSQNRLEEPTFVRNVLKPQMRARMIYALQAILKSQDLKSYDVKLPKDAALPPDVVVLQTISFDFLLDAEKNLWLLGVNTGSNSFMNFGSENFKPSWKVSLQESFTTKFVELAEEVLWRKVNKYPIATSAMFYDSKFKVLIDETLPGWNAKAEISKYLNGYVNEQEEALDDSEEEDGDDSFDDAVEDASEVDGDNDDEQESSDQESD